MAKRVFEYVARMEKYKGKNDPVPFVNDVVLVYDDEAPCQKWWLGK